MCRCCQRCWENFYWNCIEERFCYDENIANYSPEEDEYFTKKNHNGFIAESRLENNNTPICVQPNRLFNGLSPSSKIRDEDYRQIQTNVPILAPEILSVFANSQIFHDHQPSKTLPIVHKSSSFTSKSKSRESDSDKLLSRLEGQDDSSTGDPINDKDKSTSAGNQAKVNFASIREEDEKHEVILRPENIDTVDAEKVTGSTIRGITDDTGHEEQNDKVRLNGSPITNKRLRHVKSVPYFSFRPASENDIFAISGSSMSQISMTPEIPSISFSTLPKNYEDTPTIEKYKESVSLYSIQTANSARAAAFDFSMPRHFRRSDLIVQSADNLAEKNVPKKLEKSKRLKLIRKTLPPLAIHINKEKSKERNIE